MNGPDLAALDLRLRLGADALFTLDEAALLLPVAPELGRKWLEGNVRQTLIAGVVSVRWADVLRAVEAGGAEDGSRKGASEVSVVDASSQWLSTQDAAAVLGVSRVTIDRAIARLPANRRPAQLPTRGKGARVRYGWAGEDVLRAWWKGITTEQKAAPRAATKRKVAPSTEGVVDWSVVAREAQSKVRP
ncbi:MAG: hypothetical protein V4850_36660 [Myxococcota bacterium]